MKKTCDITDWVRDTINAKNPDGTKKFTLVQVKGKLQAALKEGAITQAQLNAIYGNISTLATSADWDVVSDIRKRMEDENTVFTPVELQKFHEAADRIKRTIGVDTTGGNIAINLKNMINRGNIAAEKGTVKLEELIAASLEIARNNGDVRRMAKLEDMQKKLERMNNLSRAVSIDWKAIGDINNRILSLQGELNAIDAVIDIGSRETAEQNNAAIQKLRVVKSRIQELNSKEKTPEVAKELAELDVERGKLNDQRRGYANKHTRKANQKLRSRRAKILDKIEKAKNSGPNKFIEKALFMLSGADYAYGVDSLREIQRRLKEANDSIALVESLIDAKPNDHVFALPEAVHMFGSDLQNTAPFKDLFFDASKTEKTATKDEVKALFGFWKINRINQAYSSNVSVSNANAIARIFDRRATRVITGARLKDEIGRADGPVAGTMYDPNSRDSAMQAANVLHTFLKRLEYVQGLPGSDGIVSESILSGMLGTEGISFIGWFDGDVFNDNDSTNTNIPTSTKTLVEAQENLKMMLSKLGMSEDMIKALPETNGWADNYTKMASFDSEWDASGNIVWISYSTVDVDTTGKETTVVSHKKNDDGTPLAKEQVAEFLSHMESLQNQGYKLIGHNIMGSNSDFEKMASADPALAMRVAIRSIDTMLLAFRNAPDSSWTRERGPSMDNLAKAYGLEGKTEGSVTGANFATRFAANPSDPELTAYADRDATTPIQVLVSMRKGLKSTVAVENNYGSDTKFTPHTVSPIWTDTGKLNDHPSYSGVYSLYDIKAFNDLRSGVDNKFDKSILYRISDLKRTATQNILALLNGADPNSATSLREAYNAINSGDKTEYLLELSRENAEAWKPMLKQLRDENKGAFLLAAAEETSEGVSYTMTNNSAEYREAVIQNTISMIANSKRQLRKVVDAFASKVGFREFAASDTVESYIKELFEFSASLFNGQDLTIESFGDGSFDYVSAQQVGRAFAQIMIGEIEDGIKLRQDIKAPISAIAEKRATNDFTLLDDLNNEESREYAAPVARDVAFFAPISMVEQELSYHDYVVSQRMRFILNSKIGEAEINAFKDSIENNEFRDIHNRLTEARRKPDNQKEIREILAERKALMEKLRSQAKAKSRLPLYNMFNTVNNRDLQNTIPDWDAMKEMALDVALNLPEYIAVLVHDSETFMLGEEVYVLGNSMASNDAMSSGGHTGAITLAGLPALLGFLNSYPDYAGDPTLARDIIENALREGFAEVRKKNGGTGYNRSNYFDDNMSGRHHILAAALAYNMDGDVVSIIRNIISLSGKDKKSKAPKDIEDFYDLTYKAAARELEKREASATTDAEKKTLESLRKAFHGNESKDNREFFKGAVIPKMYSGGTKAFIKGFIGKQDKLYNNEAIKDLTKEDLTYLAELLGNAKYKSTATLIDTVLGMDSDSVKSLADVLISNSDSILTDLKSRMEALYMEPGYLRDSVISPAALVAVINNRLHTMARMTAPVHLRGIELDKWVEARVKMLAAKYNKRIEAAKAVIARNGGKLDSSNSHEFHSTIAGSADAYKNQMTLHAINMMQNTGTKINDSDRAILEARIRNGRYIGTSDMIYGDHTVFHTVGEGSAVGRFSYPGNWSTNLHGGYLSKPERLVYTHNEDGTMTLDLKESVQHSMWSLTRNPLVGMDPKAANEYIEEMMVRHYSLQTAQYYAPTTLGYNEDEESRANWVQDWKKRSDIERKYNLVDRRADENELRRAYAADGVEIAVSDIHAWEKSNSTPRDARIGTRVMLPTYEKGVRGNVMPGSSAMGLGGFRPRLADVAFEDRVIPGLYNMHLKSQDESPINKTNERNRAAGKTAKTLLEAQRPGRYDPEQVHYAFPENESTIYEAIMGNGVGFRERVGIFKNRLITFAAQNGLTEMVREGNYASLYQIMKAREAMEGLIKQIHHADLNDPNQIQFLHRHFVQQLFKITKAHGDATNTERKLLDFSKSIGIDPYAMREEYGDNITWLDTLLWLGRHGVEELEVLSAGMSLVEYITTSTGASPDILAGNKSGTTPRYVQGADIAINIQKIWANRLVKEIAQTYLDSKGTAYAKGKDGYPLLSSISEGDSQAISKLVQEDSDLIGGLYDNMGLDIVIHDVGENQHIRFVGAKMATGQPGTRTVFTRAGTGDPNINRVVKGSSDVRIYLTPEGVKRMLRASGNQAQLAKVEAAHVIGKPVPGGSKLDEIRRHVYGEYLQRHMEKLADETELLAALQDDLAVSNTSSLKDQYGLSVNLYDSGHYWTNADESINMTPYLAAVSLDVRRARDEAKLYANLEEDAAKLDKFLSVVDDRFQEISFVLFYMNNRTRAISDANYRALLKDHFGNTVDEATYQKIMSKAEDIQKTMDKIQTHPLKGENPYRYAANRAFSSVMSSTPVSSDPKANAIAMAAGLVKAGPGDTKEMMLIAEAVNDVFNTNMLIAGEVPAFPGVSADNLFNLTGAKEFAEEFPFGSEVNASIDSIPGLDQESKDFLRLFVGVAAKTSPSLLDKLSFKVDNSMSGKAASASNMEGRFTISINANILKNMGYSQKINLFAHEIAHIARLAFVADGGKQWKQMASTFRSSRGQEAMKVLLLAINNNKKYDGFDTDLKYYSDNPEEFVAQMGGWILQAKIANTKTFERFVESRSRIAGEAVRNMSAEFRMFQSSMTMLMSGLSALDPDVYTDIEDIAENLFSFASNSSREVLNNASQTLFLRGEISRKMTQLEVDRLDVLGAQNYITPFNAASEEGKELDALHKMWVAETGHGLSNLTVHEYNRLRANRESSGVFDRDNPRHREEIVVSFMRGAVNFAKKAANSNTVGGALRAMADHYLTPDGADKLIDLLDKSVMSLGNRQQGHTFSSEVEIATALMTVVGQTMANSESLYIGTQGVSSVRENRLYSAQWVERVTRIVNDIRLGTTAERFDTIMDAVNHYMGANPNLPNGLSDEENIHAAKAAAEILINLDQMRELVHGKDKYLRVPVIMDRNRFGTARNDENRKLQRKNIDLLHNAIKDELDEIMSAEDKPTDPNILYIYDILPRARAINKDTGTLSQETIDQISRMGPGFRDLLIKATQAEMRTSHPSVPIPILTSRISSAFSNLNNPDYGDVATSIANAIDYLYKIGNGGTTSMMVNTLGDRLNFLGIGGFRANIVADTNMEIGRAYANSDMIDTHKSDMHSDNGDFPPYVAAKNDLGSVFSNYVPGGNTRKDTLASMVLMSHGDKPRFIRETDLIGNRWHSSKRLRVFTSNRVDAAMNRINNNQGYRAHSGRAIEDISGIRGVDVFDLMDMIRTLKNNYPASKYSVSLDHILNVFAIKINLDRGINARKMDEAKDDTATNLMIKYGIDLTRIVYGANLNTASTITEGILGLLISTRYGGNPVRFIMAFLSGSFIHRLHSLGGHNPKYAARNVMWAMEQGNGNSRQVFHDRTDYVDEGDTWWDRFKNMTSNYQNAAFKSVVDATSVISQDIINRNIDNGTMLALRNALKGTTARNLAELGDILAKNNVRINVLVANELKIAGFLEDGVIEMYQYLRAHTKAGAMRQLDLEESWSHIEGMINGSVKRPPGMPAPKEFYKATAAAIKFARQYKNLSVVESSPWDMNTLDGPLNLLRAFYTQYSYLFVGQRVERMSGRMDPATFLTSLILQSLMDFLYNLMLAISAGLIPIGMLIPGSEEFEQWDDNKANMLLMFASRNPVFGITGNTAAQAASFFKSTYEDYKGRNDYRQLSSSVRKAADALSLSRPVDSATIKLLTGVVTTITSVVTDTDPSDQEARDMKKAAADLILRFIPVLNEVAARKFASDWIDSK